MKNLLLAVERNLKTASGNELSSTTNVSAKKCLSKEIEKYANPAESALYFLKTKFHLLRVSANSGFQKWGG